jgi:hypothetical protein
MRGLLLAMSSVFVACASPPVGVLYRCAPDDTCPSQQTCRTIEGEKYCVPTDSAAGGGTAGGVSGGTAGGVSGGTSGGVSGGTAGGVSGGTAGGASGGTAGGASGGTAGGASGGTAGGASGGTAGGVSGGTAGGVSGGTAGGASGGTAGGVSGGTAGGMSGGTAGGSSGGAGGGTAGGASGGLAGGAAGGTGGGAPALTVWPTSNRRFVAIARVMPTGPGQRFATVSEPLDGGISFLETWSSTSGGPLANSRATLWNSDIRIQTIGGTDSLTAIGGLVSGGAQPTLRLESVNPAANFMPLSSITLETMTTPASRVVRIRGTPNTGTGPLMVFTDRSMRPTAVLRRYDLATLTNASEPFASGPLGDALGDDVIELPPASSSAGRVLVTGRCDGSCSFASAFGLSYGTLTPRAAWTTFPLGTVAFNAAPAGAFIDLVTAGTATFSGPVRAATDGSQFVYLGGQSNTGALLIERRAQTTLALNTVLSSSGPMTLVDLIRGPQGIFVLAWVDRAVTFAGLPVPWTAGSGANVVVIVLHPTQAPSVRTWDLVNDQVPVAFEHADGTLAILVNEGQASSFWRTPTP